MDYNEALNVLIKKQSLGIMSGLVRILHLLDLMGNPQDKLKIIHIAGTNGKGSVAGMISDALIGNGFKVGLFTSPWVIDYREQICINNKFIPRNRLAEYVEKYKDNDCSEFEFLTAIMYKYFADENVDYAVVECGMGGEDDATNVESENISVITEVSTDHTNFLGNTVDEIALQKSGIIKDNCTCILYPNPLCEHIFEEVCKKKNAHLIKVSESEVNTSYNKNKDITNKNIRNNIATARLALSCIGVEAQPDIPNLPARQEFIGNILLDGGHNISAGQALLSNQNLKDEVAIIGMMADKDVEAYLSLIAPACKTIIAVTPDNPRSMPACELKKIAEKYCSDVYCIDNSLQALKFAQAKGLSLICGSFYLMREIRKELL